MGVPEDLQPVVHAHHHHVLRLRKPPTMAQPELDAGSEVVVGHTIGLQAHIGLPA